MVKYQFNKNWSWINDLEAAKDITDKHIDIVYRMEASPCNLGTCKTNCSTNPYCLNGLGEKKLASLIQKESNANVERDDYFRDLSEYAGLKNLGATCYINTYLQVWFNNLFFREYILQIPYDKVNLNTTNNINSESPKANHDLKKDEYIVPSFQVDQFQCIGKNLQLIFSLMKESIRKSLDPNFFIKALGLDENMQQDAQEFSQLFLTTLQSSLMKSNLSSTFEEQHRKFFSKSTNNNIINDLFKGQYSYITECNSCKLQSIRNSDFIELSLNIQNSNTIQDCMNDLLEEEIMDGDNQYYCDNCSRKCNAKRMTKLASLPPVLNLQLLRFVYDRNSGYKKKLTTKIKFSETIDLKSFNDPMNKQNENVSTIYNLGAILMHVGKTAYSGHYMAQIKNLQTNKWFQFNDEVITELKKKQQLGSTEEESDKTAANKETDESKEATNSKAKTFSTSNAYLLVYYRSDLVAQMKQTDVSKASNQNEIISQDTIKLETWFEVLKSDKQNQFESKNAERETMNFIYNSLWLDKNNITNNSPEYYFISTDFLRRLLTYQNNISQNDISNSCSIQKYICQHNKLNPMVVTKLKLISKNGYDKIKQLLGSKMEDTGNLFLKAYDNQTTRCQDCIVNCFEYLKCKERLKNDVKSVKSFLKVEPLIDDISKLAENSNDLNLKSLILNNKTPNNEEKSFKRMISNKSETNNDECMLIENENVTNNEESNSLDRNVPADRPSRSMSSSSDSSAGSRSSSLEKDTVNENKENSNIHSQVTKYWIGKETIKIWHNLALKRYESQLPTTKSNEDIDEIPNNQQDSDIKILEKDGLEIIETNAKQETSNENKNQEQSNDPDIGQVDSQSVSFFNEDIICVHNNLLPGQNKRLISYKIWNFIFEKYFSDPTERTSKIFTNESRECKACLKLNEEAATKNTLVKAQKEILNDLFVNKQRPNLNNLELNTEYFLVQTDFVKEWRSMVRHSKFKDIKIYNDAIMCNHGYLPFNETTIENTMVTILTTKEWKTLSEYFVYDRSISILKTCICDAEMLNVDSTTENKNPESEKLNANPNYSFIFEPNVCEICLEKNELDKYLFENKKIFIRLIDDEIVAPGVPSSETSKQNATNEAQPETNDKNDDIIEIHPSSVKKPRLQEDVEMEPESSLIQSKASEKNLDSKILKTNSNQPVKPVLLNTNVSSSNLIQSSGTRRSKRARKCKGDYEVLASSFDTIKQIKIKIVTQLSRMISEQHIFFRGDELDNDKTLAEYRINYTDVLMLKIDKAVNDDLEGACYENAHLPEIGFKGTNLTG